MPKYVVDSDGALWVDATPKELGQVRKAQRNLRNAQDDLVVHGGTYLRIPAMQHLQSIIETQWARDCGDTIEFLDIVSTLSTSSGDGARFARPPENRACKAGVTLSIHRSDWAWHLFIADREHGRLEWYHGMDIDLANIDAENVLREWAQ